MSGVTRWQQLFQHKLVPYFAWSGGLLMVAAMAVPLLGNGEDTGGGTPYTPTRGEWLSLILNLEENVAGLQEVRRPATVCYRHTPDKPDTIQIELHVADEMEPAQIRTLAGAAEQRVLKAAKRRGWDRWVKIEVKQTEQSEWQRPEDLVR
jgi:hypothetical protein